MGILHLTCGGGALLLEKLCVSEGILNIEKFFWAHSFALLSLGECLSPLLVVCSKSGKLYGKKEKTPEGVFQGAVSVWFIAIKKWLREATILF
jgi:hypothetical protein